MSLLLQSSMVDSALSMISLSPRMDWQQGNSLFSQSSVSTTSRFNPRGALSTMKKSGWKALAVARMMLFRISSTSAASSFMERGRYCS